MAEQQFEKSFYEFSEAIDEFMAQDKLVKDVELQRVAQLMSAKACSFFCDAMNEKERLRNENK